MTARLDVDQLPRPAWWLLLAISLTVVADVAAMARLNAARLPELATIPVLLALAYVWTPAGRWPRTALLEPEQRAPAMRCVGCGCTDTRACPGGCWWSAPGWCSRCAREAAA